MIMWSRVCSGMGTGSGLPYPGNTIPFSMVLQVCWYQDFGQVSDHLTLLIVYFHCCFLITNKVMFLLGPLHSDESDGHKQHLQLPPRATARGVEKGATTTTTTMATGRQQWPTTQHLSPPLLAGWIAGAILSNYRQHPPSLQT